VTLDRKTEALRSLAIGVAVRCEPCSLWHTDAALDAGASPKEVDDALNVAVAMGGGPALAYATKAHRVRLELRE
jgi:AhpD family alkylhydroperoxidase